MLSDASRLALIDMVVDGAVRLATRADSTPDERASWKNKVEILAGLLLHREPTEEEIEKIAVASESDGTTRAKRKAAQTKLTPPEVARQLRVSRNKVLGWIKSGELRAVNVADRTCQQPRYVIGVEDLAAFEESRSNRAAITPAASKRRRKAEGVVFYKHGVKVWHGLKEAAAKGRRTA